MRKLRRVSFELLGLIIFTALFVAPLVYMSYWYHLNEKFADAVDTGQFEQADVYRAKIYDLYARSGKLKLNLVVDSLVFREIMSNEQLSLYERGEYDVLLNKLSNLDQSRHYLLRGDVYFRKAVLEDNKAQIEIWLDKSKDEYLQAVDKASDDFDAKFNYELMSDPQARQKALSRQKQKMGKEGKEPGKQKGPAQPRPGRPYKIEDIQRMHGNGSSDKKG